jgi:hypothetical protein
MAGYPGRSGLGRQVFQPPGHERHSGTLDGNKIGVHGCPGQEGPAAPEGDVAAEEAGIGIAAGQHEWIFA